MSLRPQQRNLQVSTIPAPLRGLDVRQSIGSMSPDNCLYTYNLMPYELGMIVRNGYKEHAIGIADPIRTIIPFNGEGGPASDRLFVCNEIGIYDVTERAQPPVLKLTFTNQDEDSGHGNYSHYTDDNGVEYLFYADESNGLFEYTEGTDTWVQVGGILGVDVTNIVFVCVHKQRIWLVERDTTTGWYLPVASKAGVATPFYFGGKFPHGGNLKGLWNWSVDGGAGIDDLLVCVSSSGDVTPYQGEDPSSPDTWRIVGSYFMGEFPKGRKIASEYVGNLYFLSTYGIMAMSDLTRGVDSKDISADSLSFRIAQIIRQNLKIDKDVYGWEMRFIPVDGSLIVQAPPREGFPNIQYVLNLATEGWGLYRDVPMTCFAEWKGILYFGAANGSVYDMDSFLDNALITPDPQSPSNGNPIDFSILSAYTRLDNPALFKQVQYIRPDFYSTTLPSFDTKAVYDYYFTEVNIPTTPPQSAAEGFDVGLWDAALWGSPQVGQGYNELQGQGGLGRAVAIAMRGKAYSQARLMSWDIMWTSGGPT